MNAERMRQNAKLFALADKHEDEASKHLRYKFRHA